MSGRLRCEQVGVRMGARDILRGVSFTAEAGEVTALLGPNGAGKSTLLRAVSGLTPFTGDITFDGRSLGSFSARERARLVSLVPQRSELASAMRVREVVAQGRYAHESSFAAPGAGAQSLVEDAMAMTAVSELAQRSFTELSFGEQRRVLIARALCTQAPTLLLDEPTAALDVQHALRLFQLIRRLASQAQRTIVIVLHDLGDVLQCADQAVLLRQGEVVAQGKPTDVLDAGRVREVYGVELIVGGGLGFRLMDGGAP